MQMYQLFQLNFICLISKMFNHIPSEDYWCNVLFALCSDYISILQFRPVLTHTSCTAHSVSKQRYIVGFQIFWRLAHATVPTKFDICLTI